MGSDVGAESVDVRVPAPWRTFWAENRRGRALGRSARGLWGAGGVDVQRPAQAPAGPEGQNRDFTQSAAKPIRELNSGVTPSDT